MNGSAMIDGIRSAGDRRHSSAPPPKNRHVAPSNHPIGRNTKEPVRPNEVPSSVAFGNLLKSSPSGPVESVLAAVVIAVVGFGVVMVYSASAIEATVRHHDAQYFLKRQAIYGLTALFTMWLASRFDYRKLRVFTYPILVTVTALLGLTIVGLGHRAGNAYRWIAIGPVHVQPAEMAKLGIVMWLALIMAFNVWFIIWPNQKKVLGLVEADDATKAKSARTAMVASRISLALGSGMAKVKR